MRPIIADADRSQFTVLCRVVAPAVLANPEASLAICCHSAVATTPIALPVRGLVQSGFNKVAAGHDVELGPGHATSQKPPDSDDVGQAFQLMPDTDSNPRRTVDPMIPSRIVIDVAMGSGGAFGVKHDHLGSLFSE